MQSVTFLDVQTGVFQALAQAFPDIDRYGEERKEERTTPYFLVKLLKPSHTQELGRRYLREIPYDVQYVTDSTDDRLAVADQLTGVLEQIHINGKPLIGTNMSWEIVDGVLHFYVTYRMHVWKQQPDDPVMQTLAVEEGVKE